METLSFANSCLNSARNVGNQTLSTWLKLWLWWSTNLCADVEALWWLQSLCLISWRWNFFSSLNRWVRCGIYRLMRCNHVILLIRFKLSMWFWITWKKICYIQKLGFRLNSTRLDALSSRICMFYLWHACNILSVFSISLMISVFVWPTNICFQSFWQWNVMIIVLIRMLLWFRIVKNVVSVNPFLFLHRMFKTVAFNGTYLFNQQISWNDASSKTLYCTLVAFTTFSVGYSYFGFSILTTK